METPAAAQVLALAREVVRASPADETEVTIDVERDAFVRFADVGPTQSGDRTRTSLAVRVRQRDPAGGWREARAQCGVLEPGAWRAALERALALASASPAKPGALALGGPVEVPATALDPGTQAHGWEAKASWVEGALDAARQHGLRPAGLARTGGLSRSLASSAGRAVQGAISHASLQLTLSGEEGAGMGTRLAARVDQVDPEALVERAVEKALRAQRPRAIEPGEYTVVLEPDAVASLMLFAGYHGFGAQEYSERSSFLCERVGEELFSPELSLADEVQNEVYPGLPFDGEGTPTLRVPLLEGGRLCAPVTDRAWAATLGLPCTGHGAPQPSAQGPEPKHLVVAPGTEPLQELVAGVERGLLVSQFHYTNLIDPRELVLTGMTRNGTFLIEDGRLGPAVRNLRFTDSLVRLLARVSGVGLEREVAGALFGGKMVTPALRIDGLRFTSTTDF